MRIYPAIDIKNGKAVRLLQGKADAVTDYGNPVQAALSWQTKGARVLHVVDLDGAFTGESANLEAITEITAAMNIPVQLGGGIRTMADIEDRINRGISRVILGTVAVENPELVREAAQRYPDKIAVGIDALNGFVAVRGWVDATEVKAVDLALQMKEYGVKTVIYTDISRDGMLVGPNIEAMKEMVEKTGMEIIASGGVGTLADLEALTTTGVKGVIMGKALYTGSVDLEEALKLEDDYAD